MGVTGAVSHEQTDYAYTNITQNPNTGSHRATPTTRSRRCGSWSRCLAPTDPPDTTYKGGTWVSHNVRDSTTYTPGTYKHTAFSRRCGGIMSSGPTPNRDRPEAMKDPTAELSQFFYGASDRQFTEPLDDPESDIVPVIVELDDGSQRVVDRVRVVPTPNGEWTLGLVATWDPTADGPLGRFAVRFVFPSSRIRTIEVESSELEHVHEASSVDSVDVVRSDPPTEPDDEPTPDDEG